MIQSEPTAIGFRSVSEQRTATALLLKEGQWNTDSQSFLTRETQLQEVARHFTKQHQLLRVSPGLLYSIEGHNVNAVYPQAPRELLKNYHVEASKLGEADPNPTHIKEIADVLARRKNEKNGKSKNNNNNNNNNNSSLMNRSGDGGDDEEDEEDEDDEFITSTSFLSSAQDARQQLEAEFLFIVGNFDSRGYSGVAQHILSPSKYSRPGPFISGSHAKKQEKDRGFISTTRKNSNSNNNQTSNNSGRQGNTNNGFFMTDMSNVSARSQRQDSQNGDDDDDNGQEDDDDEREVTGHQLALSQSKLRNQNRNNSNNGSKLPSINATPRKEVDDRNPNNRSYGSISASSASKQAPNQKQLQQEQQQQKFGRNVSPIKARALANATAYKTNSSFYPNATPISIAEYKKQGVRLPGMPQSPSASAPGTPDPLASRGGTMSRAREPIYSSLLHELRSTRSEVEAEAKRCSTLQAIANLGGTPEFRRTVTRIFANPDEADRISEDEMRRRQKLYEKLSKQQTRMDQEAEAAIGSSTFAMGNNNNNSRFGNNNNQNNSNSSTGNVGLDAVSNFERDMAAVASKLTMSPV